ncbi:MAG: glutathione synthase [Deltaproteobacteria bacterium]|nr:glutathione synthase [Deltaproteobacteria bacterium]
MKFLFIIDSIQSFNIETDSTFVLMLESQKRGYPIYYSYISDLGIQGKDAFSFAHKVKVQKTKDFYEVLEGKKMLLKDFDAIFMRKDPPVDHHYIYATYVLELVSKDVFMINHPSSLRKFNEKLSIHYFPDLIPPTLVTSSLEEIHRFKKEVGGEVILKPVYGHGGRGVFYSGKEDINLKSLYEMLTFQGRESIIVQKFLPESRQGDKRIVLCNGEPLGAILRVPQKEDIRANLHVGGRCMKTQLNSRDLEICQKLSPFLKSNGLYFVGIDVIGGYLIEVNITSPTCLQELNRMNGITSEKNFIDFVESQTT